MHPLRKRFALHRVRDARLHLRPIGAAITSTFGKAPAWSSHWKAFVKENADRWNIAYLQKTTLPYEDNVLDLDPAVKDTLGFPVIRITADNKDNERKLGAFIRA